MSSEARDFRSVPGWLDSKGGQRGGQTFDLSLPPGGRTTLTAPTNDRSVSSCSMILGAITDFTRSGGASPEPKEDPDTISISVAQVGETGYGTLAIWAPDAPAVYEVVIPEGDCGRFRFYPSGDCEVSIETPAASTTSLMVSYEADRERRRRGRLRIDFADAAREDLVVPLEGRVGADEKGFRKITLD